MICEGGREAPVLVVHAVVQEGPGQDEGVRLETLLQAQQQRECVFFVVVVQEGLHSRLVVVRWWWEVSEQNF